jgi:FtsP/CotA-like multicopper oxidase with cupredoxin domain
MNNACWWSRTGGGARLLVGLGIAVVVIVVASLTPADAGVTRHYYIAAEEYVWDFAPTGLDLVANGPVPQPWRDNTRWSKVRLIEYTDASFKAMKPQASWLGILGPLIRAEVGDTVVVHFLNRTEDFQGIFPQRVRALPAEAAFTAAGRPQAAPGALVTYTWVVDAESGPSTGDPSSVLRWYGSPTPEGLDAGLLGPMIITRAGMADPRGCPTDVDREFVLLFKVFDEAGGYGKGRMHSVNGYIFGNLPGLIARNGERVRWHILDVGAQNEVKASLPLAVPAKLSMKGESTIRFSAGSLTLTDMMADNLGTWALRGRDADYAQAGMAAVYSVIP